MPLALKACQSGPRFVGDPIDVVTGANVDSPADLIQRGPIMFQWVRYYSSALSKTHSSLGWGHSHDFDRALHRDLEGLRYEDPFGIAVGFPDLAVGGKAVSSGLLLTRAGEHFYVVSKLGQPDEEFEFSAGFDSARLARLRQGHNTIELRYTERGALREIIDSRGRLIRVNTDLAGRVLQLVVADRKTGAPGQTLLTYEYDGAGNLIHATDLYNTTLTFAYDAANRMTRRSDRRGYSFHFEYDLEGRCIHSSGDDGLLEVFLDYRPDLKTTAVRRGDGGQWIYAYNDSGVITQITDPYQNTTTYQLDDLGRPVQEIDPNGNVTQLHYSPEGQHDYRIDPNGHILPAKEANPNPPDPLAYQLPENPLEWELGGLIDAAIIKAPAATDPLLALVPTAVVDAVLGRTTTKINAANEPLPQAQAEALLADDFGRPLDQTGRRFRERWKYDPNGNLIEHQDRDGSVFRSVYKSWNALSQEIDPLGNVTSYEHSVQGLVAKVTDPGGAVTEYSYDLKDQLIEVRRDGRVHERYRRDKIGNVIEKIDGNGRTLVTWKIARGNLFSARTLASGGKHLFAHDAQGHIIEAQTPAGTATFTYDDDGHTLTDMRDGQGVAHEIDSGQLVSTTCFEEFKVSYETDDTGNVTVRDPTGQQHRFEFGETGLIVKRLASGVRELSQYDADGRCLIKASVRDDQEYPPWVRRYGYSPTGDLTAVSDTKTGGAKYRYDAAHRLVEEAFSNAPARHFDYDPAGNLVLQPGLSGLTMDQGNRIREANGDHFTYNDRYHVGARQGAAGSTCYEYDSLDMLVRCVINGEEWTASYDAYCRRVSKTWRGHTTTYYWDGFRLAAELRYDGSVRIYVYADDIALVPFLFVEYATLAAKPESGQCYYIHTNQIGIPIRVDRDATPCWTARFDPYGRAQVNVDNNLEMPLRFPGHYYDPETGLHYNRFRYFSPELGRYLQFDPAGLEGGVNPYAYTTSPLIDVDIDGLAKPKPPKPQATGKTAQGTAKQPGKPCKAPPVPLTDREKKELPPGEQRTPAENKRARAHFKNNKEEARAAWEQRTGQKWPTDAQGRPVFAEHPRQLKEGGNPMHVEPGVGTDPNAPHMVPGPDGLTDHQRWGAQGAAARDANKQKGS